MKALEKWILFALILGWSLVWDYQAIWQYQRIGRIKFFLLAAALIAAMRFAKKWHWSIGCFYAFVIARFLHDFMPAYGVIEVFLITATLFLIPEIRAQFSRRTIENTILAAGAIHSVLAALNLFGVYLFVPLTRRSLDGDLPLGLLGQPTVLGPFLCFAFVIALQRAILCGREGGYYWAMASLHLTVIILTKSAMTYASLAAAILVLVLYHQGIRAAATLLIGGAFTVLIATHESTKLFEFSGRLPVWRDALALIQSRPWFGYGIGAWDPFARSIAKSRGEIEAWTQLHNEPLQGLFEVGRIGVGLALMFLWRVGKGAWEAFRSLDQGALPYAAGLAIFGVNSLANFDLHLTPHGQLFMLCCFEFIHSASEESPRTDPDESPFFGRLLSPLDD